MIWQPPFVIVLIMDPMITTPVKFALVTGVNQGVGHEVAGLLLKHGLKVYGLSRTQPDFVNNSFIWLECDLSDEDSIKNIIPKIMEMRLDLLVCNADTAVEEPAVAISQRSFDTTYKLNVLAPMLLVRELYSRLHGGVIINISSVSDRLMDKNYGLYSSSKAASTSYFETLALELTDAKVYSLHPSYVDTPLLRQLKQNSSFDWSKTMQAWQIALFVHKLYRQELSLPSGSNIVVVNNALETDAKNAEKLYIYNVETLRLNEIL
jgi:NAD(P)-dependent dehydrogenase (short-subunit alcohol dehydrogenase family)